MKKTISFVLSAVTAFSVMGTAVACGGGESIDKNKTQLYVNVYEVGVGTTFAKDSDGVSKAISLKEKFEEENPNVQVIVETADVDGAGKQSTIAKGDTDIFYMANFTMSQYTNLATKTSEYLADITDIVTEGDENSIHSKLFADSKQYYNLGTEESPKYFCLPWFNSYMGLVYDIGLFKDYHLYSTDLQSEVEYAGIDCEFGTDDDNWGPDGKEGGFDDGFPATWEDMKLLLEYMDGTEEIVPFTWAYQDNYNTSWLTSVWASYEGLDNYAVMTDFDGTYTYNDENNELQTKTVSKANGYEMAMQNGKLAAVTVAHDIINNDWYDHRSTDDTNRSAYLAQEEYVKSVENDEKRVAFLMEGTWWENEARDYFDEMVKFTKNDAYAYGTREFGYFPFPRFIGTEGVPDQVNEKTVLRAGVISNAGSAVLISKNSKNLELAKKFLKFAYSDEMNAQFTIATGVTKPMEYPMNNEQLALLTPYQRSVFELAQNDEVEIVSGLSNSSYLVNGTTTIKALSSFTMVNSLNIEKGDPFTEFKYDSALSVKDYMEGVEKKNSQATWQNAFGKN